MSGQGCRRLSTLLPLTRKTMSVMSLVLIVLRPLLQDMYVDLTLLRTPSHQGIQAVDDGASTCTLVSRDDGSRIFDHLLGMTWLSSECSAAGAPLSGLLCLALDVNLDCTSGAAALLVPRD
jgi:hypothetical protein